VSPFSFTFGVAKISFYKLSASWNEFGSSARAAGISPQDINRLLQHGPPPLRHIQVNRVMVVDHLGRNIPVPTIFCSTWEVRYDSQTHLSGHISCYARTSVTSSAGSAKIVSAINSLKEVTL
jgi:hypothetical protein